MDKFVIEGGIPLQGAIDISGSKNAALPIMAACLLAPGAYRIENVPLLRDVRTMAHLLRIIGARVELRDGILWIDTTRADFPEAPYELVKTMRASIYVLGPLLARFGKARVSLPGGCAWGPRPVNLHLKGMEALGATLDLDQGYINARAKKLLGAAIKMEVSSVGATGNIMMAAALAEGTTTIVNAAEEPEIVNLAEFLKSMGAKISGVGSPVVTVEGVAELQPSNFRVIPDRIEAGTFLVAGIMTRGRVTVKKCLPAHLKDVLGKLEESGAKIYTERDSITAQTVGPVNPANVTTGTYPGYPTDMQAQWIALMTLATGGSVVTDTIYPDRFTHVPELRRLGADIVLKNNSAFIRGVQRLKGAPVMSTDLRASASLVLAALAAEGRSDVYRVYHIDRGYQQIEKKLQILGARIRREDDGKYF